jgi:hypothetical protein
MNLAPGFLRPSPAAATAPLSIDPRSVCQWIDLAPGIDQFNALNAAPFIPYSGGWWQQVQIGGVWYARFLYFNSPTYPTVSYYYCPVKR